MIMIHHETLSSCIPHMPDLILGNVYFSTRTTLQTSSEFVHHSRELSFNKWTE